MGKISEQNWYVLFPVSETFLFIFENTFLNNYYL